MRSQGKENSLREVSAGPASSPAVESVTCCLEGRQSAEAIPSAKNFLPLHGLANSLL
jgi:hypothetical protein